MVSKIGETASREATEAGALKALRPERGRKEVMGGEEDREMLVVTAPSKIGRKTLGIRGKAQSIFPIVPPEFG